MGCANNITGAPDGQRRMLVFGAPFAALGLASCGGDPLETFSLTVPIRRPARRRGSRQLVVTEPAASAPYDNQRIVIRTGPGAIAYLTGAQWAEELPNLLQTQIIQTFENSGYYRAVGRPGGRLTSPVSLNLEIRRFDIDVPSGQAVVELSAKLINDGNGRALAARIFKASVPASAASGQKATAALNQALDEILRGLLIWTSRRY